MNAGPVFVRVREATLSVGAILGSACLVLMVLGLVADVRVLLFRSGSMAPAINTGDLSVVRTVPASSLEAGDIVSVVNPAGQRVTHRLVMSTPERGIHRLTLRGDANTTVDAETYPVSSAEKVVFTVPKLGKAVSALGTPGGLVALGVVGTLLVGLVLRGPGSPGNRGQGTTKHAGERTRRSAPSGRRGSAQRALRVSVIMTTVGAVVGAGAAWAAPWTDGVPVTGQSMTAAVVPAPTLTCGAVGALSVTFNWTAVSGATNYTLHYGADGSSTVTTTNTSHTITSAISNGTAWVVANRNFGSTTWSSVPSNTRTYTVALVSMCS